MSFNQISTQNLLNMDPIQIQGNSKQLLVSSDLLLSEALSLNLSTSVSPGIYM